MKPSCVRISRRLSYRLLLASVLGILGVCALFGQVTVGITQDFLPQEDQGLFSDTLVFAYIPVGQIKLYTSLVRAGRGDWNRYTFEAGALWVWGGPLYSLARYGVGLSSEGVVHNQVYIDLFFEQESYYLMTALSGSMDLTEGGNRNVLVTAGFTYTGFNMIDLTLRGYAGHSSIDGTDLTGVSWLVFRPVDWLDLIAGGSLGTILPNDTNHHSKASFFGGLGIRPIKGWRLGYQYTREYRNSVMDSHRHQVTISAEF